MNLALSIQRLPESIRQLIVNEPTVTVRYEQGESLEQILSCSRWAASWIQGADQAQLEVLKEILIRYAALPLTMEMLLKACGERTDLTGAEVRIAVARLRRSGILFAVRKTWGDQLIYLPTDNVAIWQPHLFPVRDKPLAEADKGEVVINSKDERLPLSLELLSAWHAIHRQPLSLTSKRVWHRPSVARMTAELHLKPEELACLSLTYPHSEQLPAHAAFAVDLGIGMKVLRVFGEGIGICENGLNEWLTLSPSSSDLRLHEQVITRYASIDPGLHLAASAVHSLPIMEWFHDEGLVLYCGQEAAVNQWLSLMEVFGWLERGIVRDKPVFRKKEQLDVVADKASMECDTFFVQPDGEIFVTPHTALAYRWMLEEIAEKIIADRLFVYRLTRNSCIQAYNAGCELQGVKMFLEEASGSTLPEQLSRALQDWFAPLGQVEFAEVMLLRAKSSEVADVLMRDPVIAEKVLEKVGDLEFIVKAADYKFLRARLLKIGYPIVEGAQDVARQDQDQQPADHQGLINKSHNLALYEADRTIPGKEELFPGISSIPLSWTTQARAYHSSTRKQLIQRAIDWKVSVQMNCKGSDRTFIPRSLMEEGQNWRVIGQWRNPIQTDHQLDDIQAHVAVQADEIAEIMILLPQLAVLESI